MFWIRTEGGKNLKPGNICDKPPGLAWEVIPFPVESMQWWCLCKTHAQQHILVLLSFRPHMGSAPGQSVARKGQIWSWITHLSCAAVSRGKPYGWDGGREPVAAVPRARFPSAMQKLGCAVLFRRALPCLEGKSNYLPCQ